MDSNKATIVFFILFLAISARGYSQRLELGLNVLAGVAHTQGWEPGKNGASLNLDYLHPMAGKSLLKGGVELGYTGWGSQGLLAIGLRYGSANSLDIEILNGMAFYQQGPNYVFGTGASYTRSFFNEGKNQLLLSLGMRYTIQKAYSTYSPIYSYIDIPLRIRWGRKLNQ